MTTLQQPIGSGFGAASTTDDVIRGIDLTGKVAIVTGGYSGLGLETARTLAGAGATVVVPARDLGRAAGALAGIAGIEIEPLDLLNPASIDSFAAKFLASGRALHILVNCAGIMACPLTRDARGYEAQFATNHLGHFQLTVRLRPALARAGGARVVAVSSWGHHLSPVELEDVNFERRAYNPWAAYGQSKTANILFALALDRRSRPEGVRAFSVHPGGIVGTGLARYLVNGELRAMGAVDEFGQPVIDPSRNLKTVEQGASTIVWCATNPRLDGMGGVYCENGDISPLEEGAPTAGLTLTDIRMHVGVMPYAVDPETANRLWSLSEQLLGLA